MDHKFYKIYHKKDINLLEDECTQMKSDNYKIEELQDYYYGPEKLYQVIEKMRRSNVYDWLKNGDCVFVEGFVCINSPKYVISEKRKLLRLTQFAKDNLKECCIPNKPEIVINSPESTNSDTNLSSAYIFEDIFKEKKIDKETLNQQSHLIEKIPKKFGAALKYIMEQLDYPANLLAYDADIDPSVISKMRNNIDYRPSLKSILQVCVALSLTPAISIELVELAGYHLRSTVPKELGALYILYNTGNLDINNVKKQCKELGI